ncbi:MAG: helix-hairpin-helix domain-containing protein [Planctomycetaceae bacterium]|nr:helix-hairpin-helix domain-containing protein [Planctomycetaceae bacterium]
MSSNEDPQEPADRQSHAPGEARENAGSKDEANQSASWRRSLILFLTDEHREFLRWTMVLLVAVLAAEWSWLVLERPDPVLLNRGDTFRNTYRIDINRATWAEWIQLDDVGPSTASRIVADRKVNGPFRSLEDLMRVPGIGKATLEKMRPFLVLQSSEEKAVSSAARD